jgi:hypothetical protein
MWALTPGSLSRDHSPAARLHPIPRNANAVIWNWLIRLPLDGDRHGVGAETLRVGGCGYSFSY